jgi:hypothetical protein
MSASEEAADGFSGNKADFIAGCQEAKQHLDPIDAKRKSDSEYRSGFNDGAERLPLSAGTGPSPSQAPLVSAASTLSADTYPGALAPGNAGPEWDRTHPIQAQQRRDAEWAQQQAEIRQARDAKQHLAETAEASFAGEYQHVSIADFFLDGRKWAAEGRKISMSGDFLYHGDMDYLVTPGTMFGGMTPIEESAVRNHIALLLLDDAERAFRQKLQRCRENMPVDAGVAACEGIAVAGVVESCNVTMLLTGASHQEVCLRVIKGE